MSVPLDINQVLTQLEQEQLLETNWRTHLHSELEAEADQSPWYVRVFVALGAWVASFFLMGFIALLGLLMFEHYIHESSIWWLGIVSIGLAVWLRQAKQQEFFQHLALALVMSGEVMVMIGIAISFDRGYYYASSASAMSPAVVVMMLSQVILVFIYHDRIVQFLSFIAIVVEIIFLVYLNDVAITMHGVLFALALVFTLMTLFESRLYSHRYVDMLLTLKYALLLSVMIGMMASTAYVLPEINHKAIFPYPWISTLSISAILAYTLSRLFAKSGFVVRESIQIVSYVAIVCLVGASWRAPGLVLSLLVLLLGYASSNRLMIGIAVSFFIVFLTTFFYGIEISLLYKSYTLIGAGALLLLGWYLLRKSSTARSTHA